MIEAITAINTVLATYKAVKQLTDKITDLELKRYVLEMNEQLLDLKESTLALREENIKLKNLAELSLKNGIFFDKDGNPFCPSCKTNGKYMPLQDSIYFSGKPSLHCPVCNFTKDKSEVNGL